jgi:hypothetical protein
VAGSNWRAFATTGPDHTLIFRLDPKGVWVAFDEERRRILVQEIPLEEFGIYLVNSRFATTFATAPGALPYLAGVLVYEYRIVP